MDFQRIILLGGIFAVSFLLLVEWNKFQDANKPEAITNETLESVVPDLKQSTESTNETISNQSTTHADYDDENERLLPSEPESLEVETSTPASKSSALIEVKTDVLNVRIDRVGGDIVMVSLPDYWAELETPDIPFELLNRTTKHTYIAESGLLGKNGTDKRGERAVFSSSNSHYQLKEGNDQLIVDLTMTQNGNVAITKRFTFTRSEYLIDIEYLIDNRSSEEWQAVLFGKIKRDNYVPPTSAIGLQPFLGAATTTKDERYKKMDFGDMEDEPFKETIEGGWIAMVQHYFISAWIPDPQQQNTYSTYKKKNQNIYILGYVSPAVTVDAGQQGSIRSQFYAGPKIVQRLEEISPYLDLTVDYGWLWWVAKPLHFVLEKAHSYIGNWGWAIIVLTLIIKIALFPLSQKAYVSMAGMRKVTPKMTAIREQYGDNRQKLQEEMLKLYRTEKINPMGGCLPMLLQMPVFLALYWVLMESVELRHAPFVGWIDDLSVMDPYFCLPILMGISMYIQQKMNPTPPDPTQARVMQMLPIIFTFMFLWFPAGLVLYWLVNNIISMVHQGAINKQSEKNSS